MPAITDLASARNALVDSATKLNAVVNGPATGGASEVETEEGPVKTLLRLQAELEEATTGATAAAVAAAEGAMAAAQAAATSAQAAAANAATGYLSFATISAMTAFTSAAANQTASCAEDNNYYRWNSGTAAWVLFGPNPNSRLNNLEGGIEPCTSTVAGIPSTLTPIIPVALAGYGPAVNVTTSLSIGPLMPIRLDPTKIYRVSWDLRRATVTTPANNPIQLEIAWLDKDYAEMASRTVVELFRENGADWRFLKTVVVAPHAMKAATIVPPAGAIFIKPLATYSSTSGAHSDYVFPISVKEIPMPVAGLYDGFIGIRVAFGTHAVKGNYAGNLHKLVRASDAAATVWPVDRNGLPDIDAILDWRGPYAARVTELYCQETGLRHAFGTDTFIPEWEYDGHWPSIHHAVANAGLQVTVVNTTAYYSANRNDLTMIMGYLAWFGRSTGEYPAFVTRNGGSGRRTAIRHTAPSATFEGNISMARRRLDADTDEIPASTIKVESRPGWTAVTADHTAATNTIRRGSKRAKTQKFAAASAQGTGATSNTNAPLMSIATARVTWHDFALITDGVITDAQFEKMLAVTPDMEEIPYRASINPASHTWYDSEIAIQRPDGFVSYGYCNALGDILMALIPTSRDQVGRHYLISSRYRRLGHASDHLAGKHKYSPRRELIVAILPHAWYGDLVLLWSPTGHPKDLGPEIVITGNTSLEYAQIHYGSGRLAIFTQEANTQWRLLRQMDTNIPITKAANFEAWQSFVNHGAVPMYIHSFQIADDRVLIIGHPSPTEPENHCYLFELNLTTGLFSAAGSPLGLWDGTASGGQSLGATGRTLNTLPKIITVGTGRSVRWNNFKVTATSYVITGTDFDEATPANAATQKVWTCPIADDPYVAANWDEIVVGAVGGVGGTYEVGNVRFPGADINTRPGAATLSIEVGLKSGSNYQLWRYDSVIGDGSDWTTTLLLERAGKPIGMPLVPYGATDKSPSLARHIYQTDDTTNSIGRTYVLPPA